MPGPNPPQELMKGDAIGWGCMCGDVECPLRPVLKVCPIIIGLKNHKNFNDT